MIDNAILHLIDPSPCRVPSPESHRDGDESEATISEPKGNERYPDLLGGEQGIASVQRAGKAIGTVAKVVVGVAAIQAALAAAGLVAAGVPGAGLWALPVLAQVPQLETKLGPDGGVFVGKVWRWRAARFGNGV